MDPSSFSQDITFSDTMNLDPNTVFSSVPTLDDIDLDRYPDPEGYYQGQEEYGYDDEDFANDDDIYEPDFAYDN